MSDLKYLSLLAEQFPTRRTAYTEIINLRAILNLPCGTEHFVSDIHGELEAFTHIYNNCSGVIRERVARLYGNKLDERMRADLCTLVYYPDEKLDLMKRSGELTPQRSYEMLVNLMNLARTLADGYTRSHVHKLLPKDYGYILDELLHVSLGADSAHHVYHEEIVHSIVEIGAAEDFICSVADLIKRLAVDRLHVVGDVFDRGPRPDRIIDELMAYGSVDVQWGNHDIAWMGAAAGSEVCMAQVVRTCVHYQTLEVLESSYGISLRELALFADATYAHEPGKKRMHRIEKAINVILFKLMEQAIARHPEWDMNNRCLLGAIDVQAGTVRIDGRDWPLSTTDFPTLDPSNPTALSEDERAVMDGLAAAFADSDRLRSHVRFLFENGSAYLVRNGRLLFHGCVPLNPDGSLCSVLSTDGTARAGRAYLDYVDRMARKAWATKDQMALDWMWYLWCGSHSPLAGRTMKTFERAYVADQASWVEPQDPYFDLVRDPEVAGRILAEFGLEGPRVHIVNGHTPVHEIDGDTPVRADGKVLVIDGGFCEAYHKTTGIAGYTLIADARGLRLKAHRPFAGVRAAIRGNYDIASAHEQVIDDTTASPVTVANTDAGLRIQERISLLVELLEAYRSGLLHERGHVA
ncbi:MAG: fructose-1,6-bisphosphatase [Coriobacteriales bacterium]|nr:fructose-1,6-bisphosphatase [Coriobacteriales bacterium]